VEVVTDLHVQIPDDVAARLADEAGRRGVPVEVVLTELLAARLPTAQSTNHDTLEAFIGFGASGITEPFDIRQARRDLADRVITDEGT
jgi:hypothetical protein